ncbi:MAG TPA: HAMP domain-containing sensor histidine kinase [Galbitalea sp.]|jgi:two-component system OmpR family sensor kinase|nr:HAMP domain-containing sensor histidine kinase [Galbitalea sp.]
MHEQLTEWWNGISLRGKITGVTVLLLTLGLVVSGVGTMSFLRSYLLNQVYSTDLNIYASASGVAASDACDTNTKITPRYYFAVIDQSGNVTCANGPDGATVPVINAKTLPKVIHQGVAFTLNDKRGVNHWEAVGFPLAETDGSATADKAVIVAYNLGENESIIGQFELIFLFFALTVVVLGGALTRLLVTSTFAPLREVEQTAARFASGDFSQRLERAPRNTEVGRLNESLNTMLSRIDAAFADRERTVEQMRRFVGDASHELRTPLVSVRGYAELYRMGALTSPDEVAQAMERIEKEATRMGELVQDLLELARIDEAKPLNLTAVDLVPLANDAALDAMAQAPDREVTVAVSEPILKAKDVEVVVSVASPVTARTGSVATRSMALAGATIARLAIRRPRPAKVSDAVPVEADVADPPSATVRAEENKIRQVITNLMGNAIRFTPAGSPIEIGIQVDEPGDSAYLSVIDHGEGIPPQAREKIFQRFWRADTSRTRDTGGSGLGLAIVASIVASHGGSVDVVETPGGGATFRARLPLLHTEAGHPALPG